MLRIASLILLALPTLSLAAKKKAPTPIPQDLAKSVIANYAAIVYASYSDALADARSLQQALQRLVKEPTDANLNAGKESWKKARVTYSHTEPFRFYGGPIDAPETGPEGLVNSWPMDEAYIDYVEGQRAAGIINHPKEYPKITKELLVSLNEKNGERNISTGYHAIEFLLWGQDLSLETAGQRPVTDYQKGKNENAERRGQYLNILAELLVGHLSDVQGQWDPAGKTANYATQFKSEPVEEALRKIYTGVISLSIDEMAGERLTVPMELHDQENEQDCFSDTTLLDASANEDGIRAVYYGTYKGIRGPGLHDLAVAVDSKLAAKSKQAIEDASSRMAVVSTKIFDRIIANPNKKDPDVKAIFATIAALEAQARAVAAVGLKLGLTLNIQ